jgi:hypothetical protein
MRYSFRHFALKNEHSGKLYSGSYETFQLKDLGIDSLSKYDKLALLNVDTKASRNRQTAEFVITDTCIKIDSSEYHKVIPYSEVVCFGFRKDIYAFITENGSCHYFNHKKAKKVFKRICEHCYALSKIT